VRHGPACPNPRSGPAGRSGSRRSTKPSLRRLMKTLDRLGDRSGHWTRYEAFAKRLTAELEADPAPETACARRRRARACGDLSSDARAARQ